MAKLNFTKAIKNDDGDYVVLSEYRDTEQDYGIKDTVYVDSQHESLADAFAALSKADGDKTAIVQIISIDLP
jgi:hypothetical protein